MLRVLGRRLATGAVTLLLVSALVFGLIHLAPGAPPGAADEGIRSLGAEATAELRALYHLDRPLHERYVLWLSDLSRGDLGRSFHDRRPVADKIAERVGTTLLVNGLSLALMALLAVPLGALAALRPGSWSDRIGGCASFALYALPVFWAAILLQMLFAARLDWLPLAGVRSQGWELLPPAARVADRAAHLVLPVACLSYGGIAYLSRFVRAVLVEGGLAESRRAARARGRSESGVVLFHGFRLAGVPLLTLAGFLLPALVSGSVIVETIFALPGLGRLFVEAAFQRDVPVLMALTLLTGTATLVGTAAADLTYAIVDPRVRRGKA